MTSADVEVQSRCDKAFCKILLSFHTYSLQVKVWNTSSGFCFVTFTEHLGGITGVVFNQNGQVVLSSSLDGSVRAFDLNRYAKAVLQVIRGKRDNLGIIFHVTPLKHML